MSCPMPTSPAATEAHALYDTPDEFLDKLEALRQAGVEYVLLTTLGGTAQLRRFAREIMPAFSPARGTARLSSRKRDRLSFNAVYRA